MSFSRRRARRSIDLHMAYAGRQRSSDMQPFHTFLTRWLASIGSPGAARGRLTILMYHRVLPAPDPMRPHDITARTFEEQMSALSKVFNTLPLSEALTRMTAGTLPDRSMCITFDDGYRDNAAIALPILQRLRLPATFYVTTGVLGDGRMFNDTVIEALRCVPTGELDLTWLGLPSMQVSDVHSRIMVANRIIDHLKYLAVPIRDEACIRMEKLADRALSTDLMMTPEHVTQLDLAGMEIGGHTTDHVTLTAVPLAEAKRQISTNRWELASLLRSAPRHFAYPNGRPDIDFNAEHSQLVRELGYTSAVTTAWGQVTRDDDSFALSRCGTFDVGPGRFATRLWLHGRAGTRPPLQSD